MIRCWPSRMSSPRRMSAEIPSKWLPTKGEIIADEIALLLAGKSTKEPDKQQRDAGFSWTGNAGPTNLF